MKSLLTFLALTALATGAEKDLKAFPEPEEGMSRHVLHLEPRENEEAAKVEILIGKTIETDPVNRHFFGGKLEKRVVEGWGYSYHILPALGPMAGTLMAPPADAEKVEKFVTLGGEPYLVRYNSKLPLVVYAPKDCEVRYRIWTAPDETSEIPEG